MTKKRKYTLIKLKSKTSHFFYTTKKNPKIDSSIKKIKILKLKKYDPITKKHEWFIEKSIK